MNKFHIYWQNQHGIWQKYLTKTNEADTFRTMTRRAKSTNLRHKITDDSGHQPISSICLSIVVKLQDQTRDKIRENGWL